MTAVSGSVTVGIDIGTTSVKAVAADGNGEVLARVRVAHHTSSPAPDLLEHDAAKAWRRSPVQALAELLAAVPKPDAVCVASMVPSLAIVDERGIPRSPGLLYGDARGRPVTNAAPGSGEMFSSDEVAGHTDTGGRTTVSGTMPDAEGFVGWAHSQAPDAAGYWPAQAVANYALGRVPAIDTAMGMSMGRLISGGTWDTNVLSSMGIRQSQMPSLVQMGAPAGKVSGADMILAAGTVDALCDQIVSGIEQPGDVLVICGATLVIWAVTADWIEAPGLWTVPHTVPGRVLVGGPSNAGALFIDWTHSILTSATGASETPTPGGSTHDQGIAKPSASIRSSSVTRRGTNRAFEDPPREGSPKAIPVWCPYIRGERAPFNDPSLRAALNDLDITHDAAAIQRAAYESSGFVVRHMLDRAHISAKRIVASGGGTRNARWMQAMADATGLPVDVVAVHEGAALGAAYIARMAAGLEESLEGARRWARVGHRYEPDPAWTGPATRRYERFLDLGPRH